MMQISKKRSKNYQAVLLALGTATTALSANTAIASADTTTGWDRDNNNSNNTSDASKALSSARSDIASRASSRAASNTSAAPKTGNESKIGWVDVYVDHSNMDDALQYATARGVNVVHDPTVIKTGDASQTARNNSEAVSYYAAKTSEARSVADNYVKELANYDASKTRNQADADSANDQMHALQSTLAAQNQTTNVESKQYSADELAKDTAAIQAKIQDGKNLINAKAAKDRIQTQQDSMTLFASQESMGNIHLQHQDVTIANDADADKYLTLLQDEYKQLQDYAARVNSQTGSIPDSRRPTYKLYNYRVDPDIERKGTEVVTTYHYTPVTVNKPAQPSINYHIYDIRDQMTSGENWKNKDGETIILDPNKNANNNVVAQAMVNQTIGVDTVNQPLPSERFDKIQDLTIVTRIPDGAEFNKDLTNSDPANWVMTYDEASRTVRMTATPEYLVQVNLNQNTNNSGTVGGTTNGEWQFKAPQVFFKLTQDNHTYQTHSTIIVNKEYQYVGSDIQIRTDQADPSKVNTNSHYQVIDGKEVLPGSVNNYVVGWDFDQYKNVNIDREMQQKGLVLIDDYPEDAVSVTGPIRLIDTNDGHVVFSADLPSNANNVGASGTFKDAGNNSYQGLTWTIIDKTNAPDGMKDKIKGKALMIRYNQVDGKFYKDFVETGRSLNVIMPMTTLKIDNTDGSHNGNSYSNIAYQSDFGNVYTSNTVENTAPKLNPKKDAVISFGDLTSLDINKNPQSTIEHQSYFDYRLNGSTFSTNLSENIFDYHMEDTFEDQNDRYDGEFIVQTDNDIHFKAGSTLAERYPNGIQAGTDITKYFTQKITRNSGNTSVKTIILSADRDFLDQIDMSKTNLHFDGYVNMKRISNTNGVRNQFKEWVNGVDYGSNWVVTNSRKNAIDLLNEKLASLESSTASGISSNASGIKSNASSISSVASSANSGIKSNASSISSVASSANSGIKSNASSISSVASSANSGIKSNASSISSVASSANSGIKSNASSISSVASSANSGIKSNASAISSNASSFANALSVVIKKITDVQSSASSAISSVASDADSIASSAHSETQSVASSAKSELSSVASSVSSAVESVASSANSQIEHNSAAIDDVRSSTASAMSDVASNAADAISKLADALAKRTEQRLSTLEIFDPLVKSKTDALHYATEHGVSASQIRAISYENGRYTVKYNASTTAINGGGEAIFDNTVKASTTFGKPKEVETSTEIKPVEKPVQKQATESYDLYIVQNAKEARQYLHSSGIDDSRIQNIEIVNGHVHAVVKAK